MKKEIAVWLKQAQRDLVSSENSLKSKDYYLSALMSQQVAEKSLKALYIKRFRKLLRIHDLVKLARDVKAPQNIVSKCARINPVYTEVRYPDSDELPSDKVSEQDSRQLLQAAKEILKWVQEKI